MCEEKNLLALVNRIDKAIWQYPLFKLFLNVSDLLGIVFVETTAIIFGKRNLHNGLIISALNLTAYIQAW